MMTFATSNTPPTVSKEARVLPIFLLSQMLEVGFKSLDQGDFAMEVSKSYLAQELAKSMANQGIAFTLERDIQDMLKIQEHPHEHL